MSNGGEAKQPDKETRTLRLRDTAKHTREYLDICFKPATTFATHALRTLRESSAHTTCHSNANSSVNDDRMCRKAHRRKPSLRALEMWKRKHSQLRRLGRYRDVGKESRGRGRCAIHGRKQGGQGSIRLT